MKFGKPGFMAPEIFKTNYYNNKIDIYSLGIILYIAIYEKSKLKMKRDKLILLIQN